MATIKRAKSNGRKKKRAPPLKPTDEILQRIGANVKKYRAARDVSQSELAKSFGRSATTVANIEQGTKNVTLATLQTLAEHLGCTEADLLKRPGEP